MPVNYSREKIADGIHYSTIINKRFKVDSIAINLITELSREKASLNAVIPAVLSDTNAKLPTLTEFNKKLNFLYGASLIGRYTKYGDGQNLMLVGGGINDRYAFDGEKVMEEIALILSDCLTDPHLENGVFYEKDFALKKQELLDAIDAEINEKRSYAFKRANLRIYEGEPAAFTCSGDKEQAEKLTADSAFEQYGNLLKTAQIEVFFIGAEPNDACKKLLTDTLLKIDRNYGGNVKSKKSPLKPEVCRVTEPHDVAQSKMVMAFKTDFDNFAVMQLMNSVYGGTPFSKLFMNVREKLSLCYYCSSGYNDMKGVLYVDSGIEHANAKKAEEEILNQLEAMKRGDFTEDELENARGTLLNGLKGVNDTISALGGWYMERVCGGDIFSPEEHAERVKKVTREEIIAAANSLKLDTVYVLTGKEAV